MLSNTNDIMMEYIKNNHFKQQGLSIDSYFDQLFLSHEMKCSKPGLDIYQKMIEQG